VSALVVSFTGESFATNKMSVGVELDPLAGEPPTIAHHFQVRDLARPTGKIRRRRELIGLVDEAEAGDESPPG